jgi:hypothetical protein
VEQHNLLTKSQLGLTRSSLFPGCSQSSRLDINQLYSCQLRAIVGREKVATAGNICRAWAV